MSTHNDDHKEGSHGKETASDKRRRRLLTKLAVGGAAGAAIPSKWSKPVVDTVLLPVHAQTTESVTGRTVRTFVGGGGGSLGASILPQEDLLDFLIGPALAAGAVNNFCVEIEIQTVNGQVDRVWATKTCYNSCKPGKWYDQTVGTVELSHSGGGEWTGTAGTNNHPLTVYNINTASATKLADVTYDGVDGTIEPESPCDCTCIPS